MSTQTPVLGRGLSSLIPNAQGRHSWGPTVKPQYDSERIEQIAVELIDPNPKQPRTHFDRDKLEELAQSIKEHGIIQPLIATQTGARYQLIAGERRLKAAKLLGQQKVPVVVRKVEEQKKLELSVIENVQRQDLNPLEEALSYKRLMDEFSLTQEEVAQRVGKSRSSVANFLRLLTLPKPVLEALEHEAITFSHAKAILSYPHEKDQLKALRMILKEKLPVAQTSERPLSPGRRKEPDPVLVAWEGRLRERLGFAARIRKTRHGGIVEFTFQSDEDLKSLLDRLLGEH